MSFFKRKPKTEILPFHDPNPVVSPLKVQREHAPDEPEIIVEETPATNSLIERLPKEFAEKLKAAFKKAGGD